MSVDAPIPDDLLLIMQSYVDPPTQIPFGNTPKVGRQQAPVEPTPTNEGTNGDISDEDEVELAIKVEFSDGDSTSLGIESKPPLSGAKDIQDDSSSDSDSDSDSSDSSSDVEMRVTKYPTRTKQLASLAVLTGPNDSDLEDDGDAPSGSLAQYSGTKNEILLPEVRVPELTKVPVDDVLELIGEVMTIIDSVVVIKGHTSGVHRVLDTDSLLAFDDRQVIGVVFETFGAVKQPLYSVRFPSASAINKDNVRIGRLVYHVPAKSNFVFTQEIARIKGSDASNLHDEEVGEDQMDFSDDEAEAQWRRNRKEAKREQTLPSGSTHPAHETTPRPIKSELPNLLPYPAADDGDVPYPALPYDDMADPRPPPAAYDPYSDYEEESGASSSIPSRPEHSSPRMSRAGNESGGPRARGRERGRGKGGSNQNRRDRPNDERGRPRRGRGGRGRGRGDRHRGRGGGSFFPDYYPSNQYHDSSSTFYGTGQPPYDPSASQDEGYSPVNAGNGYWEQGTMPHINPRFFTGEMGTDASAGFGMPWANMPNMTGYDYQQTGYGYGGYDQGNDGGYSQSYDASSYWAPNAYPSQDHNPPHGQK